MKKLARKSALAGLGMAAVLGLTIGAAAPAMAGTRPTAPCYQNGVRVGDMQARLWSTSATSDDTTFVGDCGSVSVRVQYRLTASGALYWSGWSTAGDYVSTSSYPYTSQGTHDSMYSIAITSTH
jgi:hypothetical protein